MSEEKKRPVGRPSKFDEKVVEKILSMLAEGASLESICLMEDMPSARTVYRWLDENEGFCQRYARAREMQADLYADQIIKIADDCQPEAAAVAKARLQIDSRKWKASKLAPKKYGDKLDVSADMRVQVESKTLEDIFK
ncbi:hypothetical protein LVJ85_05620 [Neisseria sp. Dent CA1/247]|uniref:terminase small subunit-like protein n=1 Tax=Neisseria sp. Dent CA1/247 TaxID=2912675 RepID=UPI001FD3BDCC|nr:hypothetical protein [Neisseria sp. Dent CA1/247]UOO77940.1 hypothetical protein LVJ85_05620 [Neisseria sp. Dent CA1/247]